MFLLIDIHRNILSAQGLFKCKTNGISSVEISLEPNLLCVKPYEKSLLCRLHDYSISLPEKFLLPATISSVCCNGTKEYFEKLDESIAKLNFPLSCDPCEAELLEVRFRFQIADASSLENYILKSVLDRDFKNFMHGNLKQVQLFNIMCAECDAVLTEKSINFQPVCKYYEETYEMAELRFCHKHDVHNSAKIDSNSLYIGDLYFYFHDSIIKSLGLSEHNKEFRCIQCSTILSLKKKMIGNPHFVGFFCDKIMLVNSESESSDTKNYKRDCALFSFCSIIQELSKITVSYKMYLQCKVGEKTDVLLLWINSQAVVQFLLDVTEGKELCEKDFKGKEVYKIFYCICSPDSELSRKWKHDFDVEFFQISDNMMTVLKGLLQESSKYFPEEEQKVKDFSFGYLPVHVQWHY